MSALTIHSLPTLLLGSLIKSTFLLLAAWAVSYLLRRASAATRHLVWSVALGGVLLLPLLSLSLPQWKVAWGHASAAAPMAAPQAPLLPLAPTDAPAVSQVAPPSAPASEKSEGLPAVTAVSWAVPVPTSGHQFPTVTYALGIGLFAWLIGLLSVLCQLFVGLSRLARTERRSLPLEHAELRLAEDVRGRMGLRRPVRFLRATEANTIAVPVTWGVFRPVVLLPAQSSAWSEDCLRAALLHELAHVQRWDWPTQLMGRLACALYWWHPLVWWATRQAREESERACDDLVLGVGMKATDYAQRLVEVVRSMPEGAPSRTVAIAMAQPSEVEGRVRAVLAKERERGPVARRGVAAVLTVVALVLLPLASLRMAVQAQQADDGSILTGTVVPPGAVVTRNTRWALALISMRDVACPRFPDRPVTVRAVPDASGMQHYLFHDGRTGRDYRDSGQIRDEFARLLAQGSQPRPGAAAYPVPPNLAAMTRTYGRHLFFTSTQRAKASRLDQEARGWAARDFDLVLADGDMEPKASAAGGPSGATVSDTLLPEGAGKLAKFERAHVGEYLGIVVGDSTLPRAVELVGTSNARRIVLGGLTDVEARALADDINVPSGTEVIGGGIQRATYPDGTIYEADEDEGQQASVASGYSDVLPSGYTVEVTGVTRAKRKNDEWVEGGLRWTPSGRSLPAAAPTTSNGWSWPVGVTGGLAPHFADVRITPPHGQPVTEPFSTYLSLGGTAAVAWARTFQRWGDRTEAFYPQNGRPCSLRVGVASGAWRAVASLPVRLNPRDLVPPLGGGPWPLEIKLDDRPALMYQDRQGHAHTEYFLPAGQRLGNVARRIVAVEVSGRTVAGSSWNSHPIATSHSVAVSDGRNSDVYPVATGIFDISFFGPLVSDVSRVKEYRLETRPYQVVEFRNIQLEPQARVQPQTKPAARMASTGQPGTGVTVDTTETARARKAIHAAYSSGEGRMGILNVPRAWQVDTRSFRSALHFTGVTISGVHARATSRQMDSVTVTDPKTGQRHQATAEADFEGSWDKTAQGWIARWFRPLSIADKIDGERMTGSVGKTKSVFVRERVWPPLPSSYPYWN